MKLWLSVCFLLFSFCFFLFSDLEVFSSICLERSQSHFSGSCVMYVCLTTLRNLSRAGFKSTTNRLSYFYNWLYLCILYQWNFLYWRLKETTKILATLSGLVLWPDPDWSPSMISSWRQGSWLLISDFLGDLWLYFFFFLTECFFGSFALSSSSSPLFLFFHPPPPKKNLRVGECRSFFLFCCWNRSSDFVCTTAVSFIWLL